VGYTGGTSPDPTYKSVCRGDGHTEALQIEFDSGIVSYEQLLEVFWSEHMATTRSKPQYKSAIWYHDEEQKRQALKKKDEVSDRRGARVVTDVLPQSKWYDAEEYHQKYLMKQRR